MFLSTQNIQPLNHLHPTLSSGIRSEVIENIYIQLDMVVVATYTTPWTQMTTLEVF